MNMQQAMNLAIGHHQAGRLAEAEALYRQILVQQPDHADALHLLGVVAHQMQKNQVAVELINRAIAVDPSIAMYHNNLGSALSATGQPEQAARAYREAIRLQPDYAEAHNNLGNALKNMGRISEALDAYHCAIQFQPGYAEAHNNLGNALKQQGEFTAAIAAYHEALHIKNNYAEAYCNLGTVLLAQNNWEQAAAACRKAISLKPGLAEAYNTLGLALQGQGQIESAIQIFRMALQIKPDYPEAHNNMANALKDQGQLDAAISEFHAALTFGPKNAMFHSNLIVVLHLHPDSASQTIKEELTLWNARHAAPLKELILPHGNNRDPERRLKIGYVSADFCEHVSAHFLEPLLHNHDHEKFEIFCYAQVPNPDWATAQFRTCADHWRSTVGLTDEQLAEQIRRDDIDILVDLKLHTRDNRLLVFARKPAPVQLTWLGYPGSTGLSTMDYRLTDPHLDPPGSDDESYSEQSIRLPDCFWCYSPLINESPAPQINTLPAAQNGFVTFGCLNNFSKVNERQFELWAKILAAVPQSRLILLEAQDETRHFVASILERENVPKTQLEFVQRRPRAQYLKLYHRIDVGLDTLPYNGHTTTLDSLWMGVPVVSLSGNMAVGRAGKSHLTNIGLPELIAPTPQEYVTIAAKLANDLPRLAELRKTLRKRMENSPLMDAKRFVRNVEAIYREVWRKWANKGDREQT